MISVSLYIVLIAIVCIAGYSIKSLSLSGSIMAFVTGCCIAIGFKWQGLFVLGLFFASSSIWSKFKKKQKEKLGDILEKGERRDYIQVLANGSIASMSALLFYVTNDEMWMLGFFVSIAAANSDTWASEIGVLSKGKPFYLLTLQRVERGTSGAVSLLGLLASLAGASIIAVSVAVLFPIPSFSYLFIIILFGFLGSLVDTLLGATIQARYTCQSCGLLTEKSFHCGERTVLTKGLSWCNNDMVNWFSILLVTLAAVMFL